MSLTFVHKTLILNKEMKGTEQFSSVNNIGPSVYIPDLSLIVNSGFTSYKIFRYTYINTNIQI